MSDVFQAFPDGWDFTPDVGNGQSRGEIFTPRFMVEQMILEANIFPSQIVKNHDYSGIDPLQAERMICSRVLEPAVGTGNYSSVVLWHKLHLASEIATSETHLRYLFIVACASMYFYDIDPGNLMTAIFRLFGKNKDTEMFGKVDYWTKQIIRHLEDPNPSESTKQWVRNYVQKSLDQAFAHWGEKFSEDGVVHQVWHSALKSFPKNKNERKKKEDFDHTAFWANMLTIISSNALLFNGIVGHDTILEDFVVPGWKHIEWCMWEVKVTDKYVHCSPKSRSLFLTTKVAQKQLLEQAVEKFKAQHYQFNVSNKERWDAKESEQHYKRLQSDLSRINRSIVEFQEHEEKRLEERPATIHDETHLEEWETDQ